MHVHVANHWGETTVNPHSTAKLQFVIVALLFLLSPLAPAKTVPKETTVAKFRMEEVAKDLGVGYAVLLVDVDHDQKKDIVVVDQTRVIWYQNPTWKKRVVIEGQTKPDNVCIDAHDIDGDGKIDFALGAQWNPSNTKSGGTIQWLKRGDSLDAKWTVHAIAEEPTVHRLKFADTDGDGKPELIVVPLHGMNSTAKGNWMDGQPVRTLAFHIPKDPIKDRWDAEVLDHSLRVIHGFYPIKSTAGPGMNLLMASYDGVSLVQPEPTGKWKAHKIGTGNQDNPKGSRGASEIKQGTLKGGKKVIATIEPWHGNQVVVYTEPATAGAPWQRHLIDDELRWGHAVWFADLDGDGGEELIIGVRDDPKKEDKFTLRRGVRVYKAENADGSAWSRQIVDNGGMACEDLAAADLNGDGRPDIVAAGRQTNNLRIYWNEGKAP